VVTGGATDCAHEWTNGQTPGISGGMNRANAATKDTANFQVVPAREHATCTRCGAWRGELGSEPTSQLYIAHLVEVFREVARVMRPDATLWLNCGDSYSGSGKGPTGHNGIQHAEERQGFTDQRSVGPPAKSLCLIPERLAIALQDDGWYIRSRICWAKTSPMPESVTDRPTSAWEHIFLLTKRPTYYYDAHAVRQPYNENSLGRYQYALQGTAPTCRQPGGDVERREREKGVRPPNPLGANLRNFWLLPPEPFPAAHFATFPPEIPRRAILAGTSAHGACPTCGAGWVRRTERTGTGRVYARGACPADSRALGQPQRTGAGSGALSVVSRTTDWQPTCTCADPRPLVPPIVLDPFSGAGTTVLVANRLGRRAIGLELNANYAAMSRARIESDAPLVEAVAAADGWAQAGLFAEEEETG